VSSAVVDAGLASVAEDMGFLRESRDSCRL